MTNTNLPAGFLTTMIAARQSDEGAISAFRLTAYSVIRDALAVWGKKAPRTRNVGIAHLAAIARDIPASWYAYHGINL